MPAAPLTLSIEIADKEPVRSVLLAARALADAADDTLDNLPAVAVDDAGELHDALSAFNAAWTLAHDSTRLPVRPPSPEHPSMREPTAGREPLG